MIRETCSCGATIEVRDRFWSFVSPLDVLESWRANHNHELRVTLAEEAAAAEAAPSTDEGWVRNRPRDTETADRYETPTRDGLHVHDWVTGPRDFHGPPRCCICNVTARVSAADVLDIANDGSD